MKRRLNKGRSQYIFKDVIQVKRHEIFKDGDCSPIQESPEETPHQAARLSGVDSEWSSDRYSTLNPGAISDAIVAEYDDHKHHRTRTLSKDVLQNISDDSDHKPYVLSNDDDQEHVDWFLVDGFKNAIEQKDDASCVEKPMTQCKEVVQKEKIKNPSPKP